MIATSSPEPDNDGKETGYLPEGITTASEEWYES